MAFDNTTCQMSKGAGDWQHNTEDRLANKWIEN